MKMNKRSGIRVPIYVLIGLAALLTSCASRPESGFLAPIVSPDRGGADNSILIATTRERDARPGTFFNGERSAALDFAAVTVSVPPVHRPGAVEWPSSPPGNPQTDFVVREAAYLDGDKEFIERLNAQLASRPRGSRKVLLFVHGFNTLFAEGIYRLAQIAHDSQSTAVPVLFTWASRGKLGQYVYDMNSATAARDNLEHTIRLIFASDADQVNLLAHSMGNWVTVETLRQIKISGHLPPMQKLGMVMLAAPDIDLDVFKSQMRTFGKVKKPFYVILAKNDRALWASSILAGGETRVGDDADVAELAALGAVVIDLTDVKGLNATNHDKFALLAQVAPQLATVLGQGVGANEDIASKSQQVAGGTLGAVVQLPATLLGAPITITEAH
jgi:esterase/lipase superfamily enzyme